MVIDDEATGLTGSRAQALGRIAPDGSEVVVDTLYDLVGSDWFDELAKRFYDGWQPIRSYVRCTPTTWTGQPIG
ncbi:MAG: hypothetical protein Ct9H300mP12_05040 [Acidimicrobiales bacterium]|nr:MAG: hypothetical protein Ct9H300mP12_05040 [Acidimicrobiales bacterium]